MKIGADRECSSLHHLVLYLLQPHHDDFWNEKSQDSFMDMLDVLFTSLYKFIHVHCTCRSELASSCLRPNVNAVFRITYAKHGKVFLDEELVIQNIMYIHCNAACNVCLSYIHVGMTICNNMYTCICMQLHVYTLSYYRWHKTWTGHFDVGYTKTYRSWGLAPLAISRLAMLVCPLATASCKGVSLSKPGALISAPWSNSSDAISKCPWLQHSC